MNKIIIIALIILVIIIFIAINNKKEPIKTNNPKELELTYEINAGIPFRWEYEIEDKEIVEFVKSYVIRDDNKKGAITGASVYTNYVFKGLKKGTTTITFKYVNFADNYISHEEKHKVIVDENNNISLEGE